MTQATLSSELLTEAVKEQEPKILRVCFVCTGNTCRSPMAQAVTNHLAKKLGRDLTAFSRGLYALDGDPIASCAIAALEGAGIEPTADHDTAGTPRAISPTPPPKALIFWWAWERAT